MKDKIQIIGGASGYTEIDIDDDFNHGEGEEGVERGEENMKVAEDSQCGHNEIEILLATDETSNIIRNLYPLYLHDLSEFNGSVPNEYGIYEEDPLKTLEEQYHTQDIWFQKPDTLFPFIIFVENEPAGFALVSTGTFAPKGADYYMYEFFILRPYRGKKVAERAAKKVFDKFQGKWELYTNPSNLNKRAQNFWHKVVNNYSSGDFEKSVGETFNGEMMIFRFRA